MKIYTKTHAFNGDAYTPVSLYRSIRHKHRKVCLLESNDYSNRSESNSYLGFDPLVELLLDASGFQLTIRGRKRQIPIDERYSIGAQLQNLLDDFVLEDGDEPLFFGRIGFEFAALKHRDIELKEQGLEIPLVHLFLFRYLIELDHFKDEGKLLKQGFEPVDLNEKEIHQLLHTDRSAEFPFETLGAESEESSKEEYLKSVERAIVHCRRGDVFQLVLSNAYRQPFFGDDFEVYRSLRRLNPSPYLFYFDFESYRLFGSSPEAQLKISGEKAEIHPIAGTVMKSGNEEFDRQQVTFLKADEKENAEHTMLVDLARNDLSKHCSQVRVEKYKEIQHFSHVYHIVSKVTGKVMHPNNLLLFEATFPAGTLSGSPKHKALELISRYEVSKRDFYGGAVGIMQSSKTLNMAIVIRSMLSKNNVLHYRAGAGIVLDSVPEKEYMEIQHKLGAVRKAIQLASTLKKTSHSILESHENNGH